MSYQARLANTDVKRPREPEVSAYTDQSTAKQILNLERKLLTSSHRKSRGNGRRIQDLLKNNPYSVKAKISRPQPRGFHSKIEARHSYVTNGTRNESTVSTAASKSLQAVVHPGRQIKQSVRVTARIIAQNTPAGELLRQ